MYFCIRTFCNKALVNTLITAVVYRRHVQKNLRISEPTFLKLRLTLVPDQKPFGPLYEGSVY